MIDPRILALIEQMQQQQPQPQDTGLLGANPMQLVQNDNVPATSRYGTSVWDLTGAAGASPGTARNDMADRAARRPNMLNDFDLWQMRINRMPTPANISPFGGRK